MNKLFSLILPFCALLQILFCFNAVTARPGDSSVKSEHCKSEPVTGEIFCAGYFPKFTFKYDTMSCEPYIYGGCGATANLYDTLQECMSSCVHGSAPTEEAPVES
uniref:Kunitz-type proteinase inhibitor SHPI-1 n=2 Tax=Lepeophtheirus salmonis TaxID=72036 RepID=C1BUK1_LEPSM|nr:Kunitz-type proteinase inhibitor SHPI-1 [Lepeophtheirus salmonis]ADD24176.1 Trypsin and chymotrypsim bi-functional serine protease inhibitor [Lepeophtheirus salmonis]ADD38605.1 Trypsin and chymotrypsim bi-functional serine protease inhibitor [Lepeophtheirus salmonis]